MISPRKSELSVIDHLWGIPWVAVFGVGFYLVYTAPAVSPPKSEPAPEKVQVVVPRVAPGLVAPESGVELTTPDVHFSWQTEGDSGGTTLEISTDGSFSGGNLLVVPVAGSAQEIDVRLNPGDYDWRVRVGADNTSPSRHLKLSAPPKVEEPKRVIAAPPEIKIVEKERPAVEVQKTSVGLVAPQNDASLGGKEDETDVAFEWSAEGTEGKGYFLWEVTSLPNFAELVDRATTGTGTKLKRRFNDSGVFFWRVTWVPATGTKTVSEPRVFTLLDPPSAPAPRSKIKVKQ